jgi:histidyl-tRNA synthetase
MTKPTLPQGTRDFGPDTVRKRNYILDTIRHVFELYGFEPLETPAMENLETLTGKYGEEGDKLIFKILNNGLDNPSKEQQVREDFEKVLQGRLVKGITERALKYDLTIPFARYVATHHATLNFPFKRYQVQPVWRADRPQRGRYREFYQCDCDVVGSHSLTNEVELAMIYSEVFNNLGLKGAVVRMNHRGLLLALAESCDAPEKLTEITVAIDKIDKAGWEKVKQELQDRGLDEKATQTIRAYLDISGSRNEKLGKLKSLFPGSPDAQKAIADLEYVFELLEPNQVYPELDCSLARGLNYYTGCIFEATAPPEVKIGSIGGGGRYDDLTGLFGVPNIPGVGISFGVDRIYDVLEEMNLFPSQVHKGTVVLFFNLGEAESRKALSLMPVLRKRGIGCELYHETQKFDRQFRYAERKNIPYVIILGERELAQGNCTIKKLSTGEQEVVPVGDLHSYHFN